MFRFCSWIFLLLIAAPPVWADVTGRVVVVDGDTIDVAGVRVRLHGIDAPERDQICTDAAGLAWECGVWAHEQVDARYGGQQADCRMVDTDRYGRMVARCAVQGRDMGEALVAAGVATAYRAYSWDYDLTEKAAQIAGTGIWAGAMQNPAAYRAAQQPVPALPPGDCTIKGNISDSGQIYHMPHNRDYARTRISEAQGERWFCSPAEAEAAGWRAARN